MVFGFQPLVGFFTQNTKWRHLRLAEFLFSAGIFGAGRETFFSGFRSLRVFLGLLQVVACSWVFGLGFKAFLWIFPTSKELIPINNPFIIFSSENSDWKSKMRLIYCRFLGSIPVNVGKSHSDNLHLDFWKLQG